MDARGWLVLALLSASACVVRTDGGHDFDDDWTRDDPDACYPAEQAHGGDGGDAGTIELEVFHGIGVEEIAVTGGSAGMAGTLLDEYGANGEPGASGLLTYSLGFGPEFDDTGIDPDAEISVAQDGAIAIRGVDLNANVLELDRLIVAADQELHVFGGLVVRARSIEIGTGAVLHVYADSGPLALSTEAPRDLREGGLAILTAGSVDLRGAIDVSGTDAVMPGQSGAHGGDLILRTEDMTWLGGALLASGGTGADGIDIECVE